MPSSLANKRWSVFRLRPASALAEGVTHASLRELAAKFEPAAELHKAETWPVAPNASPLDDEFVQRLREKIADVAAGSDLLVVDICYEKDLYGQPTIDWLLYRALSELSPKFLAGGRVVVLTDILPSPGQHLFNLADDQRPEYDLTLVDGFGRTMDTSEYSELDISDWITEALYVEKAQLLNALSRSFIRGRGIFSGDPGTGVNHFKFQYVLPSTAGQLELASLLGAFLTEQSAAAAIFSDPYGGEWLEGAVREACDTSRIPWCTVQAIAPGGAEVDPALAPLRDEVLEALADSELTVALVVPAYKDGRSLGALRAALTPIAQAQFVNLSILYDAELPADDLGIEEWYRLGRPHYGNEVLNVFHFLPVPIVTWPVDSWALRSAMGVASPPLSGEWDHLPIDIGIWSLLADYPVGKETAVPASRRPIAWYPDWRELDPWDSVWLGDRMLEKISSVLGCHRNAMLLVLPEDDNATVPLAKALKGLDVATLQISREALSGDVELKDADLELITSFKGLRIISLDEFARTGETLGRIDKLIQAIRGRPSDMRLVALSALDLDNVTALFYWNPQVESVDEP